MNTESNGISIQTMCYQCQALSELCPDCQEQRDARDTEIAHQIVDESSDYIVRTFRGSVLRAVPERTIANGGSVAEPRPLSSLRDEDSGHDWVGTLIRVSERKKRVRVIGEWNNEQVVVEEIDGDYRSEFLDPIAVLTDRLYDLETSVTLSPAEVICQDCHLVYNKWSVCPNCN